MKCQHSACSCDAPARSLVLQCALLHAGDVGIRHMPVWAPGVPRRRNRRGDRIAMRVAAADEPPLDARLLRPGAPLRR